MTTLQRESRHHEERARELERQVARLELECHGQERDKSAARHNLSDFVRRLDMALGNEGPEPGSQEGLIHKASELVQVRHTLSHLHEEICSVTEK